MPTSRPFSLVASALFALAPASTALAQGLLSCDESSPVVRRIERADGSTTATAFTLSLPGETVLGATGLARHPASGLLYALVELNGQAGSELVTVNEDNGVCSSVGDTGDSFESIVFAPLPIELFAVTGETSSTGNPESLFSLSTVNATATLVATLGAGTAGEALAFDFDDLLLYHLSGSGTQNTDEILETIDPGTFTTSPIPLSGADASEVRAFFRSSLDATFYVADVATDSTVRFYTMSTAGELVLRGTMDHDCSGLAPDRPANDSCFSAIHLPELGTYFGSLEGATDLGNISCNAAASACGDVWYSFTAGSRGDLYVRTCGTNDLPGVDLGTCTVLSVYSSCTALLQNELECTTTTQTQCAGQDVGQFGDSLLRRVVFAGQTVWIRVSQRGDPNLAHFYPRPREFVLDIDFVPDNDDCIDAERIMPGETVTSTLIGATPDTVATCDCGGSGSLWYYFVAPTDGTFFADTCGTKAAFGTDTTLHLRQFNCGGQEYVCNDSATFACPGDDDAAVSWDMVAGEQLSIRVSAFCTASSAGGFFLRAEFYDSFGESCSGDGGDQMGCTDCPCTNNAPPGSVGGCTNSAGTSARLLASGSASVALPSGSTSDLRFGLSGAPPSAFGVLTSGDAIAPTNPASACFGLDSGIQSALFDGLRCAVGSTLRHGGRSADTNGDIGVTNGPWGGEGGPPAGIAAAGAGFAAGQTRAFQAILRDDPLLSCMRGLNTSQAVSVTFTP